MAETRTTCCYCGVGCGVIVESDGRRITGVRGDPDHPANAGRLCTKGSTLHLSADPALAPHTRLLHPMRRTARGARPGRIGWDEALDHAAARLDDIVERHGADAVGFYVSGQLLTEDYYVFNKLVKGLLGTNQIDSNSRLCMSSAVAGYKATLGADAPPACYDDIARAHTLFIAGANTAWAHPVLFRRIEDARRANPALRLIVADPRRTETAAMADLHLPLQPGSDVALFHGMLHLMLRHGWVNRRYIERHTQGFEAVEERVRAFPPEEAARLTGLPVAQLEQAARAFAGLAGDGPRRPTLSLYCQGLNQSRAGTDKNVALIQLHLATGQIGRPGAGPFSLTGQPNAMGGREVGAMATLGSAHRDLSDPDGLAELARLWQVERLPQTPGRTAVEMFQAAADGEVRALWIACTNPAQSMPDQATVRRALQRAEFVVVQEAFAGTATAAFADLLLPATTWGEKDGTVTNSERRISRVRPAVEAPGEARPDHWIAAELGRRLERRRRPGRPTLFPYLGPESIWNEHRETTRGRDLDITGLSYALLERAPRQWPFPDGAAEGRERLYEDGLFPTPDGRARFVDVPFHPVAEACDGRYPFALTSGRLRDQWHGMSRTGLVPRLFGHVPEPAVELHPQDLRRLQLSDGDLVHVTSRRGSLLLPVQASDTVVPQQAHIAMHWGEEFVSGEGLRGEPLAGVNALTQPAYCPKSKQPELKHCAVKVLKAELPWRLLAMAWLPPGQVAAVRQALRERMPRFAFAACVPFGHGRTGVLLRAAASEPADRTLLDEIEALLQLHEDGSRRPLRYEDRRRGQRRTMKLVDTPRGRRLEGFLMAGDTAAEGWVRALLQQDQPADAFGRLLLSPTARAPVALAPRARQVCSCFDIDETQIRGHLAGATGSEDQRLHGLQQALRCGTNCGSCVPALKHLVRSGLAAA